MTAISETTTKRQATTGAIGRLIWVSPLAMLTATVANLGLYAAAGRLYPEVTAWLGAGVGQIVGATIVYLLIGTLAFGIVAWRSTRPARHYTIVATIGLLLTLAMPIAAGFGYAAPGAPPADLATVVTLSLMHVMAYTISVPMFTRLALD